MSPVSCAVLCCAVVCSARCHHRVYTLGPKNTVTVHCEADIAEAFAAAWDTHDMILVAQPYNKFSLLDARKSGGDKGRKREVQKLDIGSGDEVCCKGFWLFGIIPPYDRTALLHSTFVVALRQLQSVRLSLFITTGAACVSPSKVVTEPEDACLLLCRLRVCGSLTRVGVCCWQHNMGLRYVCLSTGRNQSCQQPYSTTAQFFRIVCSHWPL